MAGRRACYLDSNICISFLESTNVFHTQSVSLITSIHLQNFIPSISPLVLDETIHILIRNLNRARHPNPILKTRQETAKLLKIPGIRIVHRPLDVPSQLKTFDFIKKFALKARDAYPLLAIKHNKIGYFATFDHDFDLVFKSGTLKQFLSKI